MKYDMKQLEKFGIENYIKFKHDNNTTAIYCIECRNKKEIIYESVFGEVNKDEVDLAINRFLNRIRKEKLNRINEEFRM
jgi:hypothetical protein